MLGFDGITNCFPFPFTSSYDVKQRIQEVYSNHQVYLCKLFEMLDWVCLTVDVWSTKHRSFLGVTAHGINPQNFERVSVALCCTRFPHPHTGDNIAEQMQLVYATFNLSASKVSAAVTDNAANFCKAFREHGENSSTFNEYVERDQEYEEEVDFLNTNGADAADADSIFFPEVLESTTLPNRFPCSCHNFNLIGTKDICEAQKDPVYKKLYLTAFPKMNKLWNKTKASKSSETIKRVLGCNLGRPVNTRWNSIPTSVKEIISKDPSLMDNLMTELGIPTLTLAERQFLKEWVDVLTPITTALVNLEGSSCHFGALLPTLFTVKSRLNAFIVDKDVKYCKPLAQALLDGLQKRFVMMDLKSNEAVPALIATCTHPYFKLRWLGDKKTPETIDLITRYLVKATEEFRSNGGGCAENAPNPTKKGIFSILIK